MQHHRAIDNVPKASDFERFLRMLYNCKVPFKVKVRQRRTRGTLGSYSYSYNCVINIYACWASRHSLFETAIHEYAHHIHLTERYTGHPHGEDQAHGKKFWAIYGVLMSRALQLGLCTPTDQRINTANRP